MVDYQEMDGSPTEDQDANGFKATRRLKCAWTDRFTLLSQLLAFPGALYEHKPETLAVARTASSIPFGGQNGSGTTGVYQNAIITVNYATPRPGDPETVSGDDVRSESLEPNAEFLTLDYRKFKWQDGDMLTEHEAPGKLFLSCDYVITRYAIENIPSSAASLIGHVNENSVFANLLGLNFAAETLLYNPPVLKRATKFTSTGLATSAWNIDQKFSHRPTGWNKFWRAKSQTFETLQVIVAGGFPTDYKNYPIGDFTTL